MFAVIYSFSVHEGMEDRFESAWSALTRFIRAHEGSHGSRLHKAGSRLYIAYAFWPDRETWSRARTVSREEGEKFREAMRDTCAHMETVYELDVRVDLLSGGSQDH